MAKNIALLRKSVSRVEWEELAALSGTSTAYLSQIALGFRRPSVSLAEKIEASAAHLFPEWKITKESLVFVTCRQPPRTEKANERSV